jgi:hypothetical protein
MIYYTIWFEPREAIDDKASIKKRDLPIESICLALLH